MKRLVLPIMAIIVIIAMLGVAATRQVGDYSWAIAFGKTAKVDVVRALGCETSHPRLPTAAVAQAVAIAQNNQAALNAQIAQVAMRHTHAAHATFLQLKRLAHASQMANAHLIQSVSHRAPPTPRPAWCSLVGA